MKVIMILLIIGVFIMGCSNIDEPVAKIPTTTVSPTPTSNLTDEQILQDMFISHFTEFDSQYMWAYPLTENKTISKIAMQNAINGTASFRMEANTPQEAFNIYLNRPQANMNREEHAISGWGAHFNMEYGIAVYKNGNKYNISMAFYKPNPPISVLNPDGSYKLIQPEQQYNQVW